MDLPAQAGIDRAGMPRLRVNVDGVRVQLSRVVAFCWHRPLLPAAMTWREFSAGPHEADHLPFARPDGCLATRVDIAAAGWVEAVTRAEHYQRSECYRDALEMFARLRELEREVVAWAPLLRRQTGAKRRKLADVTDKAKVAKAQELLSSGRHFAHATQPFCRLTWDIDWTITDDQDSNPYVEALFVQAHRSDLGDLDGLAGIATGAELAGLAAGLAHPIQNALTPRQALLAHLIRDARLRRSAALASW
jgi:hypothetical protein